MTERGLSYAPLPSAAFEIAAKRGPAAMALVWSLYVEAHRARWGVLRHSLRRLGEAHGLKKDAAAGLVDALADRGLLRVETVTTGSRTEGVRLVVFDPTTITDSSEGRAVPKQPGKASTKPQEGRHGPATDPPREAAPEASSGVVARHEADTRPPPITSRPIDRSTGSIPPTPRKRGALQSGPPAELDAADAETLDAAARRRQAAELRAEGNREYIARRVLQELGALEEPEAESFAKRCTAADGGTVDHIARLCRPRERLVHGVQLRVRDWPEAPSGIRKSDIAQGLHLAAARWRARDRAPPGEADRFTRVLDRHADHHDPGAPP